MTEVVGNSATDPTTTLVGAINASVLSLTVAAWATPLPQAGDFRILIDQELIAVGTVTGAVLSNLARGIEGTMAASHLDGADVTLVLTAGGLDALIGQRVIQQSTDPGAVGEGVLWVNTAAPPFLSGSDDRPLLIRNAANDAWIPVGLAHYDSLGNLRGFISFTDGGMAMEQVAADGTLNGAMFFKNDGTVSFTLGFGIGGRGFKVQTGGSGYTWGVAPDGSEFLIANAAPADGAVDTSELLQWFDDTVGAPEHRFKAKDSAGTLVAGKVASLNPGGTAFLNVATPALNPSTATTAQIVNALIALGLAH